MTAGPWMRLCGLTATAAAVATVASGSLGVAHRALAVIAIPPLVALVIAAWTAHRELLPWMAAALGSFTNFAAIKDQRLASVVTTAQTRFDWERLMREVSMIMPMLGEKPSDTRRLRNAWA